MEENIKSLDVTEVENYKEPGAITNQNQTIDALEDSIQDLKIQVKSIIFKMSGRKVSVEIDHSSDGHEAREAIKAGFTGSFSYQSNGNIVQYDNMILNHIAVDFETQEQARLFLSNPEGFFVDPGNNAYRIGKKYVEQNGVATTVEAIFNLQGEVVDISVEELSKMWKLKASNYSPNSVKKGTALFYNANLCSTDEEEDFVSKISRGGNDYNKIIYEAEGEIKVSKYAEDQIRFYAGKASSTCFSSVAEDKAIRSVLSANGVDISSLKETYYTFFDQEIQSILESVDEEVVATLFKIHKTLYFNAAFILGGHFADGQVLLDAEQTAYISRFATGKKFTGKGFLGLTAQGRQMATCMKSAGFCVEGSSIFMIIQKHLAGNPGAKLHTIDMEALLEDFELAMEVAFALKGDYHMLQGIEGFDFKANDIIVLGYKNEAGAIVPQALASQDEMKHGLMPTEKHLNPFLFGLNIMKVAGKPKGGDYTVNVSGQIATTIVAKDGQQGTDFLVDAGKNGITSKFESLVKETPKKMLDGSMLDLSKRSFATTDVAMSMPSVLMKHENLAKGALDAVVNSAVKDINKDRVSAIGANLVIIPDMFIHLGYNILKENEVFLPSFEKIVKFSQAHKAEKIKNLNLHLDSVEGEELKEVEKEIDALYEQIEFLEKFIIFIARHPKMSSNQYMNYKVVSIGEIEARSLKLVSEKVGYKKAYHHKMMKMLSSVGEGVVMMPAFEFNQMLHSGNDYDIDAAVGIVDKVLCELAGLVMPTAAIIDFKS